MSISLKSNIDKFIKDLDKKKIKAVNAAHTGLMQGMRSYENQMIKEQMTGRPGLKSGTGALRGSWFIESKQYGNDFSVSLATRSKYAKIHQDGGTLTSTGKMFSIPLTPAARKRWPREWSDLKLIPRKGKSPLLATLYKKGGIKKVHYVLKRKITIPKRLYIPEKFLTQGRDLIMRSLRLQVRKYFGGKK